MVLIECGVVIGNCDVDGRLIRTANTLPNVDLNLARMEV